MATGLYPSSLDREYDLLFKAATNLYNYALSNGGSGLNPPSLNDRDFDLQRKMAYYTASIDPQ